MTTNTFPQLHPCSTGATWHCEQAGLHIASEFVIKEYRPGIEPEE
jgi:hypothetical protein